LITFGIEASLGALAGQGAVTSIASQKQSVVLPHCRNLGSILGARIQLCGRVVAVLDGKRLEGDLPGRQGRLLFAYLAANRLRAASRAELIDAVWPVELPGAPEADLSALVSKLRRVVGQERLEGRSELRLALPDDAWIDTEVAAQALHRAEAADARSDWPETWVAARIAQHIAVRPFVDGEDAGWIDDRRRQLEGTYLRSLELAAHASLRIGGGELDTAERAARSLTQLAPFRESGYRYLMEALAARDNRADALYVYDQLRTLLRDELGAAPSPATHVRAAASARR
jgi:DNA-binding SARP family transcriptional activator